MSEKKKSTDVEKADADSIDYLLEKVQEILERLDNCEAKLESLIIKPTPAAPHVPQPRERGYVPPKIQEVDSIAKIRDGDKDMTLDVQIETIGQTYSGTAKTGKDWSNCRVLVSDQDAQMYLVLWNDQVDLVDKLRPKDSVRLHKVYAKESPKGDLELGLGKGGSITARGQHIL